MIILPIVVLFVIIVVALIAGRRHPAVPIALFAALAGVFIGTSAVGPPVVSAVERVFGLFG